MSCERPPAGWRCTRKPGHDGPCAALPVEYSHLGWFGICPVLLGNLHSECPKVAPRWDIVVPLFVISEWWQGKMIWLRTLLDPSYVPEWKLRVTRKIHD